METFQLNPNITFQNILENKEVDFWSSLFDTPYTKHLIFDVSVLTIALLFPMFILIFMHIQDKGYRTVLTYGEVMAYFYAFVYLYISFPLDVIRIISGPMPRSICWFTIYAKNFAVFGGQFAFIVCIIIRVSLLLLFFFCLSIYLFFSTYLPSCISQWPFVMTTFLDFFYTYNPSYSAWWSPT